jgi:hypothetical protein
MISGSCPPHPARVGKEMPFRPFRPALLLLLAALFLPVRADDILFIGNSFTFGGSALIIQKNGGVPRLVEAIARAKGRTLTVSAVTAGGKDWSYHLAQPATEKVLRSKTWTWVVLQDFSTRPTRIGNIPQFLQDGETFSQRIAQTSPNAGILLFETWSRPPGLFYRIPPGNAFTGPAEMMDDLHQSYARLRQNLVDENKNREVRVTPVGAAFARARTEFPALNLDALDHHHASREGYYLAALVIYESLYRDTVQGAPTSFFHGQLTIPAADAAKLQHVAGEVLPPG